MKPVTLVLFGITGDLARHKVIPAICRLIKNDRVPPSFRVIGVSRQHVTSQQITSLVTKSSGGEFDEGTLSAFENTLSMIQMDPEQSDDYTKLAEHLNDDSELFIYLSLPPQVYSTVINNLADHELTHAKLLVEKPFGFDLTSARQLITDTAAHFKEEQVYRIDHFLAKEMAQQIQDFRKQQPVLQKVWDAAHIESIEVIASESIGIAGRASFYDNVGALRDVIQSHLLQLLAVVLGDSIQDSRLHVLRQLNPASPDRAERGQYKGYDKEVGRAADTYTETYAAITLTSNDPRWQGTSFTLKTGKALALKYTGIIVTFRGGDNHLEFRIQPGEGIVLKLDGSQADLGDKVDLALNFPTTLDAYERVLTDAIAGDRTLFATDKQVLESWRIVQPVLDVWQVNGDNLVIYEPGTDGP